MKTREELVNQSENLIAVLNKITQKIADHPTLKYMQDVIQEINLLINAINQQENEPKNNITVLNSHLEAIRHCLRLYIGKCELTESLTPFITVIKKEINGPGNEKNGGTAVQPDRDDFVQEKRMVEEQKYLESLTNNIHENSLKRFLFSSWVYLIKEKRPAKKIFLSYAWAKEFDDLNQEAWSKVFVAKLVVHLIQSGMQIYLDQYHSGAGKFLGSFMGKINDQKEFDLKIDEEALYLDADSGYTIDHVFVVSSRTLVGKLNNPSSGCYCEHTIIKKRMTEEKSNRFIIPLQLNKRNYLPNELANIVGVGFCEQPYLQNFKELFRITNRLNQDFLDWSNARIKEHRLGVDIYIANGLREKYLSPEIANIQYLIYQNSIPIKDCFINLALIQEDEHQEKETKLKANNLIFRDERIASYEDIHRSKSQVDLDRICISNGRFYKNVLVEGRAGIGKSILMQYLANQWALLKEHINNELEWLAKYDAVILLPLRKLHECDNDIDLASFIHKTCFTIKYQQLLSRDMIQQELLDNPNISVFYLPDGFDEVVSLFYRKSAQYNLLNSLLVREHKILTARPNNIDVGLLKEFRHLEVVGFVTKDIAEYIRRFFLNIKSLSIQKQQSKTRTLIDKLDLNPSVKGIAHIPINLELICCIWEAEEFELEHITITMLYQKMLAYLLRRYLLRLQAINKLSIDINIFDLTDNQILNHPKCQTALRFLEELAWNVMQQKSLLIKSNAIKELVDKYFKDELQDKTFIEDTFKHLFLLKPTGEAKRSLLDNDYYFIHLTFQEFLAAKYWVSNFISNNQADVAVAENWMSFHVFNPVYQMFWRFSSGLLCSENIHAMRYLKLLFQDDFNVKMSFKLNLWISCVCENKHNQLIQENLDVDMKRIINFIKTSLMLFIRDKAEKNLNLIFDEIGNYPYIAQHLQLHQICWDVVVENIEMDRERYFRNIDGVCEYLSPVLDKRFLPLPKYFSDHDVEFLWKFYSEILTEKVLFGYSDDIRVNTVSSPHAQNIMSDIVSLLNNGLPFYKLLPVVLNAVMHLDVFISSDAVEILYKHLNEIDDIYACGISFDNKIRSQIFNFSIHLPRGYFKETLICYLGRAFLRHPITKLQTYINTPGYVDDGLKENIHKELYESYYNKIIKIILSKKMAPLLERFKYFFQQVSISDEELYQKRAKKALHMLELEKNKLSNAQSSIFVDARNLNAADYANENLRKKYTDNLIAAAKL